MSRRAKAVLLVLIVAAVGTVATVAIMKRPPAAIDVRIEAIEARDLVASVTASGQVQPRSKVSLSADITGRIVDLAVKEGDFVEKGQFLLRIDPAQYEAAVQRAEAALASAKAQAAQSQANATQAQRNLDRSIEMRKTNVALISEEQMEQLQTQVMVTKALAEASRHSVDQAIAGVNDAKQNLSKTTITAPMSGRVTRLNVEEGETAIMGNLNRDAATLLTISDMSVLETQVRVDETDVSRIQVGDSTIIVMDAFRDTSFLGRVVRIANSSVRGATAAPAGQDVAVDYLVTIELLNAPDETRPDFSAVAKIVTDQRHQVLSVPIIALTVREHQAMPSDEGGVPIGRSASAPDIEKKDAEGVFVVGEDNKVTFRPVKVGIAGEKYFEVLSGLTAGERIVAGTYQAIRSLLDGKLVRDSTSTDTTTKSIGG